MKKHPLIISVFVSLLFLVSCDNSYMYKLDDSLEEIKQKTSIKTFEHLKEPIVIALPVYDNYYLFGNKNKDCRQVRAGDIIAVIDIETDTVYDWVFFPGDHGWSIWRLVEAGSNPTRYLMSSVGTESVATLDPSKTELTITKTGIHDNLWCYKAYGTKVPLCYITRDVENNVWDYHTQLFDSATNTLSEKDLCVQTSEAGSIYYMRSDFDGNIWISYPHKDGTVKLQCFDIINESIKNIDVFFNSNSDHDTYNICFVSEEEIFVSYHIRTGAVLTGLYIVEKNTGKKEKVFGIEGDGDIQYVYDVQKVNGNYYAIVPNVIDPNLEQGSHIYKIDMNTKSAKEEFFTTFDMTENTYVRGNRIYFMCSRDTADITYTYYDTEKKEQGPITRISAEQIIESYLNK